MDVTSIGGIVASLVLILAVGIGPANLGNFVDVKSLAIVLGGTICAVIASYPARTLKEVGKHLKLVVMGKKYDIGALLDTLVDMAFLARKNGLLALEEKANELDDAFFKQGIMMIVDATEPEEVRALMENELDTMSQRHEEAFGLYEKASAYAPAFGMIGTLVGLINMLKGMDLDSGSAGNIGPDMAVALVTTFYGCMFANVLFLPIAKKLRGRNEEELLYKQIIIEGILAIQSGDNPKFLKERLLTYLAEDVRQKIAGSEGGEEGGEGKKKAKKEKKEKKK